MFQKICPRPANPNVVCVYNSVSSCVRWGLAWAWAVFCLFAGSSAFADPSFIKNPAATAAVGGATGFDSSMSVSGNGEGYITTRGTPIPIVISPNATPQNVLIAPVANQTPVPVTFTGLVPAEATIATQVIILPTALPTTFPTPQFGAVAAGLKYFWITNTTNQDIWCSAASTSPQFFIPAGSTYWTNLAANGLKISAGIGCIHPANTPASGQVTIGGGN